MARSNTEIIQDLQAELLQDFFEIQMIESFQDSWKSEVLQVAVHKQHSQFSTYGKMKRKFDQKGLDGVTVKDFDVTALAALIRFDFSAECCPHHSTDRDVGHIALDRNDFAHLPDHRDTQLLFDLETTAIDNMTEFLTHLQEIAWNHPMFFRKYLGTGHDDGLLLEIAKTVSEEQNDADRSSSLIRHYLQELVLIREDRESKYVGLSYNSDGKENEKRLLDDLIDSNLGNSKVGMRIVAESGYGKSWTLFEIAGRYAKAYLENSTEAQVIPIVIEMGKLYKDCSSIRQRIAQLFFGGDEGRVFEFYRTNRILLLIDAMDEANSEIQSDVSRELASMHELYPNLTFVCASRKSCIDQYPITIPCYAIKELDEEQVMEYMEKAIPEMLVEQAKQDWIGDHKKEFLSRNRTPFYINCYVELLCETGSNDFVDTTQLIEKFLHSMIDREIRKTGFQSDKATFLNFLIELCRLLDTGDADGEKVTALPELDVIRELTGKIPVEEGQASIKAVGRKLVEIQILARDEEQMLLSFAHQNYKEYFNRKYPARRFRSWNE